MPQETLDLLNVLESQWGMTDHHFVQVHHFGDRPQGASIATHRAYCATGPAAFHPGAQNDRVKRRLRVCLQRLQVGDDWDAAIAAALAACPM